MTQAKIESDKLFISAAFKLWYQIPDYQRPYVWGTEEVSELLDDLADAAGRNPEAEYFLGS